MRKSQAIKILEKQKQIFIEKNYQDRSVWKQLTSSYILDFLGQESSEYYAFYKFSFDAVATSNEQLESIIARKDKAMIGLIDNCIDKIKLNGLPKNQNKNVLSTYDNWKLITIAVAIFIAGLTVGIWINEKLSIHILSPPTSSLPNNETNKVSQADN